MTVGSTICGNASLTTASVGGGLAAALVAKASCKESMETPNRLRLVGPVLASNGRGGNLCGIVSVGCCEVTSEALDISLLMLLCELIVDSELIFDSDVPIDSDASLFLIWSSPSDESSFLSLLPLLLLPLLLRLFPESPPSGAEGAALGRGAGGEPRGGEGEWGL
jgi:hypothetical protein